MNEMKQTKPFPKLTKRELKQVREGLIKFEGIPEDAGKSSSVERNVVLYAICGSCNKMTEDSVSEDAHMTDLLMQLLSEIDSGENLSNRIIQLAVSTEDWQKLLAGKKRMPTIKGRAIPVEVGMRIIRS